MSLTNLAKANNEKANNEIRTPHLETFKNLFKRAIIDDKPVLFDYWVDSIEKQVSIGVRDLPDGSKEKILVRSGDEYTSPISNIFKSSTEFIIITANSIYVVDAGIPVRKIAA